MSTHQDRVNNSICAAVILYNPEPNVSDLIETLAAECGCVYVVDNSEVIERERYIPHGRVELLHQGENIGLSEGYNMAVHKADVDGFTYLCFFDQDSIVNKGFVGILIKEFLLFENKRFNKIILGMRSGRAGEVAGEVEMSIGSGLVIRVADIKDIGYFDQRRIVDGVDEEFCLRARYNGYRIFLTERHLMSHQIGNVKKVCRLFDVYQYSDYRLELQAQHTRLLVTDFLSIFPKYVLRKLSWQLGHMLLMVIFCKGRMSRVRAIIRGFLLQ